MSVTELATRPQERRETAATGRAVSERVARLRERSQAAVPRVSSERARLLTRFYAEAAERSVSVPVLRAQAFAYLLCPFLNVISNYKI